jgi:hypothetical protein
MNQSANKLIPPQERHAEADCEVPASPLPIFEYIDRPERLSAHMERRSWRMGGGTMTIETDAGGGRAVGSRMRLAGRVLGIGLAVEGEVTERKPPYRKVWQTVGEPRLLVVGAYRMQVTIVKRGTGSHVRIAIDYALPSDGLSRWLGILFGAMYARWCVNQMIEDVRQRFAGTSPTTARLQ